MTDPHSNEIIGAQTLGQQAYLAGASGRDNPYRMSESKLLCIAWIRGFNAARTDRAREIEAAS